MLKNDSIRHAQRGINLVELLVGMAISLVLLTGVLSIILWVNASGAEIVQSARLNQQLRSAMDLMTRELQRAGYVNWSGENSWEWDEDGPVANPYTLDDDDDEEVYNTLDFYEAVMPRLNEFGEVSLFSFATAGNASSATSSCFTDCHCILYSYDIDKDGGLNTGDFELFGFRWHNQAIQIRTAGDSHACNTGTWQNITDSNIVITNASFSVEYVNDPADGDATVYTIVEGASTGPGTSCTPGAGALTDDKCLWRRKIAFDLEAALANDQEVVIQLLSSMKIKNDHLQTAP